MSAWRSKCIYQQHRRGNCNAICRPTSIESIVRIRMEHLLALWCNLTITMSGIWITGEIAWQTQHAAVRCFRPTAHTFCHKFGRYSLRHCVVCNPRFVSQLAKGNKTVWLRCITGIYRLQVTGESTSLRRISHWTEQPAYKIASGLCIQELLRRDLRTCKRYICGLPDSLVSKHSALPCRRALIITHEKRCSDLQKEARRVT
jgi:hypothetical protein